MFALIPTAHADDGWARRWLPNVGLIVARDRADAGRTHGTSIGLEGSYTYYVASLAPMPSTDGVGENQAAFRALLNRVLTFGVGFHAQAELANAFGSPDSVVPRFSLGAHAGGFLGVELGLDFRAAGNGWATTGSFHVAPYLSVGAFSVAFRVPFAVMKLDASDRLAFDEEFSVVVKIAPIPLLAIIMDWDTPFNPERDESRLP